MGHYRQRRCVHISAILKPLHERVGTIKPLVFMSEDVEQYYHAWSGVFGHVPKKLLCSWHDDRAWTKAIYEHVSGPEPKLEVYHMLRALLNQCNVIYRLPNSSLESNDFL